MHSCCRYGGRAICTRVLRFRQTFSTQAPKHILPGFCFVPQRQAWILERMGKFSKVLDPGIHFTLPFIDKIAYSHSLKETSIDVPTQHLTTKDNIPLLIHGFLHARIDDPVKASYETERPYDQLVQFTGMQLRTAIAKMNLRELEDSQEEVNKQTLAALLPIARGYGIRVIRFSIRDILVPDSLSRAQTLEIEARHEQRARVLASETHALEKVNDAKAAAEVEALMIAKRAGATAKGIEAMGLKLGNSQYMPDSPISAAAQFFTEFSKQPQTSLDTTNASEATNLHAEDPFVPQPPGAGSLHTEDEFVPQPLSGAGSLHAENEFTPQPLPGAANFGAEDEFVPQSLPGGDAEKIFVPKPLSHSAAEGQLSHSAAEGQFVPQPLPGATDLPYPAEVPREGRDSSYHRERAADISRLQKWLPDKLWDQLDELNPRSGRAKSELNGVPLHVPKPAPPEPQPAPFNQEGQDSDANVGPISREENPTQSLNEIEDMLKERMRAEEKLDEERRHRENRAVP